MKYTSQYIWRRRVSSVMLWLVPWEGSGLPTSYSPHQADTLRDDHSLIRPPLYSKVERKFGYLFIWTIIDHSSALLIGCLQQSVKWAALFILVICEDINTFFNTRIVRNNSFAKHLSSCPVRSSRRTRMPGFVSVCFLFFFFLPCQKEIFPYTYSTFSKLSKVNLYRALTLSTY